MYANCINTDWAANALQNWLMNDIFMNHYIDELREGLTLAQEKQEDIAAAVKYAENLIALGLPVIFDKEHFAHLVGREKIEITHIMFKLEYYYYNRAYIKKKNGGERILDIPAVSLRIIQKWILDNILYNIKVSEFAVGFCKQKSIVTNASYHVGKECVINLDIKDFFPSITQEEVFRVFYYYGYTAEVSHMLARLCTYNGYLPQGAVTSPYISNIVCLKLDKRISSLAEKYNAFYSRYADDITLSGHYGIKKMLPIVRKIVEDEGFSLNDEKTRILYYYQRQEITGLVVNNGKVRVPKNYLKRLKQEIYYCKKYGPSNHLKHENISKNNFKDYLYGKVYFVYMVDKAIGKGLLEQLNTIDWNR